VDIRPAQPTDSGQIAAIWYEGWRDGHLGHVPDALLPYRSRESFEERAADHVGDTTVAAVGDEIAGFVMVIGDEVEQVYVSAGHRGTGIAGTLLSEAERLVAANGHDVAWLAVATGNARARHFYERQGWTDRGAFDYPAYTDEGPIAVPCHRYEKPVSSNR
jgi:ribosomal protein S18 acetylase RimI-like enzyme